MNKHIQLIYNPMAGSRSFPGKLDFFMEVFQKKGFEVRIRRTESVSDFKTYLENIDLTGCEAIIVAGGDGSINQVVNSMMNNDIDLPLGIIPAGTANDFAKHLGIPFNLSEATELLAEMNIREVDIGKVNDQYFINVCCGGLFANISQNVDIDLKNTLGKLAYYIKGVQQLPKFNPLRFKINTGSKIIDNYFLFFLVLNGTSAGGFNYLGKHALLDDGYMDFVGIKETAVNNLPAIFSKILFGDHLEDSNVVFFQSNHIKIELMDKILEFSGTDIDGEAGPEFPLDIQVIHKKLRVIGL